MSVSSATPYSPRTQPPILSQTHSQNISQNQLHYQPQGNPQNVSEHSQHNFAPSDKQKPIHPNKDPSHIQRKPKKRTLQKIIKQRWLFAMLIPGVVWMIIFNYIPMYGIVIAFKDYTVFDNIFSAPWVGLKNFVEFFNDDKFWLVMRNTLGINAIKLAIGFPLPIALAILINEIRFVRGKKIVQTVSYLPHFFSWVVLGGMIITIFSETGIFNRAVNAMGLADGPVNVLTEARYFWGLFITSDIWKELGWNSIIFLAAIAGIDPALYEAASMDGATKIQKIWHITLPSIKGIITILLVLSISAILNTSVEQFLILQNPLNLEASEVIDTLVYKLGLQAGRFSYAAAVGLFKAIIALILLVSANYASKRFNDRAIF